MAIAYSEHDLVLIEVRIGAVYMAMFARNIILTRLILEYDNACQYVSNDGIHESFSKDKLKHLMPWFWAAAKVIIPSFTKM